MNREIKVGGATLVLTLASGAHSQGSASSPANGASVPMSSTPPGGDVWAVAIIGGFVGGAVAGVIVAVAVISQLKKSLNANTAKR